MEKVIKNGLALLGDEFEFQNVDILIKNGLIETIDKNIEEKGEVIDANNKIIMPGLVNAHTHSDEGFFKGMLRNLPLELWMLYTAPVYQYGPFSKEFIYLRTMISAIEMLKRGVTHVQDAVSLAPKPNSDNFKSVVQAYKDVGLRASIAANSFDKPWHKILPYTSQNVPEEITSKLSSNFSIEEAEEFFKKIINEWHNPAEKTYIVLEPSAPQRCSDEFLLMLHGLSEKYNLPFHTHVLETKVQAVTGEEFYGKSIIKYLDDLNILDDKTTIIHSIWVDDEDIELMGKAGASVAHNPISNLKIGSGVMPLRKLIDSGVNIALGTDGISSTGTQNIFEVMKYTGLIHNISNSDFNKWPSYKEVFRMGTLGGAKSTLTSKEVGSIKEGKKADLVLLDLNSLSMTPTNNILKQLVYCEDGHSVETVIIDGEIVMKDKKIKNIDEDSLIRDIKEIGIKFKEEYEKSTKKQNNKLFPFVESIYWKCERQDVGIKRRFSENY